MEPHPHGNAGGWNSWEETPRNPNSQLQDSPQRHQDTALAAPEVSWITPRPGSSGRDPGAAEPTLEIQEKEGKSRDSYARTRFSTMWVRELKTPWRTWASRGG